MQLFRLLMSLRLRYTVLNSINCFQEYPWKNQAGVLEKVLEFCLHQRVGTLNKQGR